MAISEKERAYRDKYDAMNMKAYTVKYNIGIYEQVERAMVATGMNRNQWTTLAVKEKLERDGFPL